MARALIALVPFFLLTASINAQDLCRDVLVNGIRDTFKTQSFEQIDTEIKKYVKMSLEEAREQKQKLSQSGGGGLDIIVVSAIIGADGGWEKMNEEQRSEYLRKQLEQQFESRISENKSIYEFKSVASKTVVSDWLECMKIKYPQKGLLQSETVTKNLITMNARWNPLGEQATTTITSVTLLNAVPVDKKAFDDKRASPINAGGTTFEFKRLNPHEECLVVLQTPDGAFVCNAPAWQEKDTPAQAEQRQTSLSRGVVRLPDTATEWTRVTEADKQVFLRRYHEIRFAQPFVSTPVCGIESFTAYPAKDGAGRDRNGLLSVWTTNVTKEGMTLVIRVQHKGDADSLVIKWMAVGEVVKR